MAALLVSLLRIAHSGVRMLMLELLELGGLLTVKPQAQAMERMTNSPPAEAWLVACLCRA